MMSRMLILLLAAWLVPSVSAKDFDCGKVPLLSTTKEDGSKVVLLASEEQFMQAPTWAPGKGEPPLSVSRAVQIAEKWAKNEYKRYDTVKIESIHLTEFGCIRRNGYWYYTIHFSPVIDGNVLHGSGHFAAVLLNGTVIGPTKQKSDF